MAKEFRQIEWDAALAEDCRHVVRLAVREDLDRVFDWTTVCLVPPGTQATGDIVARKRGIVAGLKAAAIALEETDAHLKWSAAMEDGSAVDAGQILATITGSARSLLTVERIVLNLIGRLSGIATLTRAYVDAIAGTQARIYDTRKTTPGWRRLEKYAVRAGGGNNHRMGLYDAILIKDNHLIAAASVEGAAKLTPAGAVRRAREFAAALAQTPKARDLIVEVEVDTLEQLDEVLGEEPDLVLLDNMSPDMLRQAVARRDARAPSVELESSGGVTLETVAAVAATGIERISVGALTHSAPALDIGMDWR